MSPGCATRLTCADGTRAFVKAVGAELNPDTPGLFRREIGVLDHLGEHELWAPLLASYDDGAWVALLIEDVEGARTSRCARWSRSTSTCPPSTISASGSRGGCWRPWPDAPGAERCSTYVGRRFATAAGDLGAHEAWR